MLPLAAGASARAVLLPLAYAGRIAWRRALVAVPLLGASLVAGSLYRCTEHARVTAQPVATGTTSQGETVFDHTAFDVVLARFVDDHGMVDYRGLVASRALLDEYVGQLATASPRSHPKLFPTKAHEMAYWINAYNALAIVTRRHRQAMQTSRITIDTARSACQQHGNDAEHANNAELSECS